MIVVINKNQNNGERNELPEERKGREEGSEPVATKSVDCAQLRASALLLSNGRFDADSGSRVQCRDFKSKAKVAAAEYLFFMELFNTFIILKK